MKRPLAAAAAALGLALAGAAVSASAQNGDAAASIRARQTHYKEIGKSMKGVVDQLKAPQPSVPAIQGYAKTIATYAPQVSAWFPRGSGSEAGVKTAAKAEIWAKPQEFAQKAAAFDTESKAFYAVAQKGDLAAIKGDVGKLGATCKSCHDEFRVRDKD